MKMLFGGDFQSQVYDKGGLLTTHQRYVLEMEGLTGVRKEAIESYITENKLSDNDVLNIVIGLGRKQLKGSDVSSAIVGVKGNDYSKKIIAFAKNNKGMKMYDGGDFQSGVYANGGYFDGSIPEVSTYMTNYNKGGAMTNERLHVNKDEDYEVRYSKPRPHRKGYKGLRNFDEGGEMDLTDDKRLRLRKPVMPERKMSEQEWAEKHNPRAYEYMTKRKMATGGGVDSYKIGDKILALINPRRGTDGSVVEVKVLQIYSPTEIKVLYVSTQFIAYRESWDMSNSDHILKGDWKIDDDTYQVGGKVKANQKMATGGGVGLIGNQKRIDMNKNGKIDAEDFKLLRSSMNGALRNERKHVNHNEDYEVRYSKPRPKRTGYKGKRNFMTGGKMEKCETGTEVKKGVKGGIMTLAKKIRKDGESWQDAVKRAGQQLK